MPGVRVGHGDSGPGCFTPTHEPAVTNGQLFGWEVRQCASAYLEQYNVHQQVEPLGPLSILPNRVPA